MKKIVKNQLIKYLDKNKISINEQSGFHKCFSCETVLQDTLIEWKMRMDESKIMGVIFIDFKRAFETINRRE